MWPFKWKLSACTYTWCHLFLEILENEMWNFGRNLPLATFGSERVNVQVFLKLINPFTPELPVWIHVLSTACYVISFSGQGQLCLLTCAEWRDLSNNSKMSTIQSRTLEKKGKNHLTLTWKSPWKSCSIAHLPFLSPNGQFQKISIPNHGRLPCFNPPLPSIMRTIDWL